MKLLEIIIKVVLIAVTIIAVIIWHNGSVDKVSKLQGEINVLKDSLARLTKEVSYQAPSDSQQTVSSQIPATLKPDSFPGYTQVFVNPDSLIANRFPYAILEVVYNARFGTLEYTNYSGFRARDTLVGSFYLRGSEELTYETSPLEIQVEEKHKKESWLSHKLDVVVNAEPSFTTGKSVFDYISETDISLAYSLSAWKLTVSAYGGVKYRGSTWTPTCGVECRFRILGR